MNLPSPDKPTPPPEQPRGNSRIFFLEDDDRFGEAMQVLLPLFDFECTRFKTVSSALKEINLPDFAKKYDLALLDGELKEEDGSVRYSSEVARRLREKGIGIPIVLSSARYGQDAETALGYSPDLRFTNLPKGTESRVFVETFRRLINEVHS